jgi:predicted  nucleic acid-binding Zn-ribbon protein
VTVAVTWRRSKELVRELQHLRELKAIEDDRKDLVRELQRLRERLAALEGKQAGGTTVRTAGHVE